MMLSGVAGQHHPKTPIARLLGFPVVLVAAAKAAVLAELQPIGRVLFVFERVVITTFAIGASHDYHHAVLFFCHRSIRETQSAGHKENGAGPVPGGYDSIPVPTTTRARLGLAVSEEHMFDFRLTLVVGLGAALGGMARLLITQLVISRAGGSFAPWATMLINVSGSFLIGLVVESATVRAGFPPIWRSFLATGILGGYTTFSTFSIEALSLGIGGSALLSTGYVVGSVALGIVSAFGGIVTARAIAP